MTLTRITSMLGAAALGGLLVASTNGAQAARAPASAPDDRPSHHHSRIAERTGHFEPPMVHKYGPNGMRLGLHCETRDVS